MPRSILLISFCLVQYLCFSQYNWKLSKDQEGIQVFTSSSPNSSYKAVRVECTFPGNYSKLISILSNIEDLEDWIYHNKRSFPIKKNSPYDYLYYSETRMPWPLDNRDVVLHLKIQTDSLPKFLVINGRNEENIVPKLPFIVRVPHYSANWKVTMPTSNKIHISYILDLDPGGLIPSSIANMFVDKGPFETFKNLAKQLAK